MAKSDLMWTKVILCGLKWFYVVKSRCMWLKAL